MKYLKHLLIWATCIGVLFACSTPRTADETAVLFMDQYLIAADQRAAIKLTTGRATADLQKEIDLLAGLDDRDQSVQDSKPDVRFEQLFRRERPNGDVAMSYAVYIQRPGVELPPHEAFLLVGLDGEHYKIKSFSFRSPSDTRTSNTP